jgi:hypothetical protein
LLAIAIALAVVIRGSGAFSADLTLTRSMAPTVVEYERPRMGSLGRQRNALLLVNGELLFVIEGCAARAFSKQCPPEALLR